MQLGTPLARKLRSCRGRIARVHEAIWSRPHKVEIPRWLEIAIAEIGVSAHPAGSCNPRVTEYHEGTNIAGYDDKASWCSSFINWTLGQAGITGTGSPLARSWLEWGESLDRPVLGCITVLWREQPTSWRGHVGYYLREDNEFFYLLGGNQLEQVRAHFHPKATVLGHRWPSSQAGIPSRVRAADL